MVAPPPRPTPHSAPAPVTVCLDRLISHIQGTKRCSWRLPRSLRPIEEESTTCESDRESVADSWWDEPKGVILVEKEEHTYTPHSQRATQTSLVLRDATVQASEQDCSVPAPLRPSAATKDSSTQVQVRTKSSETIARPAGCEYVYHDFLRPLPVNAHAVQSWHPVEAGRLLLHHASHCSEDFWAVARQWSESAGRGPRTPSPCSSALALSEVTCTAPSSSCVGGTPRAGAGRCKGLRMDSSSLGQKAS